MTGNEDISFFNSVSTGGVMQFKSHQDAITYFQNAQAEIAAIERKLKEIVVSYKQETRDYFGVSDGDPMNLIQLASLVQKLQGSKHPMVHDVHDVTGAAV